MPCILTVIKMKKIIKWSRHGSVKTKTSVAQRGTWGPFKQREEMRSKI